MKDRDRVISRERTSKRETRQFNRITVGSKLASGNWCTGVADQSYTGRRGSYFARIPKRFVIDRTSRRRCLDEFNETRHRSDDTERQNELIEGPSEPTGWRKQRKRRHSSQDIPVICALIND